MRARTFCVHNFADAGDFIILLCRALHIDALDRGINSRLGRAILRDSLPFDDDAICVCKTPFDVSHGVSRIYRNRIDAITTGCMFSHTRTHAYTSRSEASPLYSVVKIETLRKSNQVFQVNSEIPDILYIQRIVCEHK